MSLLKNTAVDEKIENESDVLGGSGPLDSDAYPSKIDLGYLSKSDGGALSLVVHFKTDQNRDVRQTFWVTSGDKKGNKNYYEKNGEKNYLPGFTMANSLCLLAAGKNLSEMVEEEKTVALYNFEAKAEVPTKVIVLPELLDQEIVVGLLRQTVDKTEKNDNDDYVPTGETRDENEAVKFFRARDLMTTAEIRGAAESPEFHAKWVAKWKGTVRDKSTGAQAGTSTGAIGGAAAVAAGAPPKSLFA